MIVKPCLQLTGKSVDLKSNSCAFAEGSDYDQVSSIVATIIVYSILSSCTFVGCTKMMLYAMDPSLNYFEPQDVEHTIKFFQVCPSLLAFPLKLDN